MNSVMSCPSCQAKVSVPEELVGKQVQCPQCKHIFTIKAPTADAYEEAAPTPAAPAPVPRSVTPSDQDEWDDAPRRRRYEEDDDYGLHRRLAPHRGAAVLTLGILSLVVCGPIMGPIAWVMGNNDLREMQEGRMDPSGEGITQAGRIIGIVATIFSALGLTIWCLFFMAAAGGGAFR
jgi:hypothetical protein